MPKKQPEEFTYLSNDPDFVPDPEIEEFMEEEIARAPKDPDQLAQRLRNNTAASPQDAGGDLDANWEDVNDGGTESVAGDNPTPDQDIAVRQLLEFSGPDDLGGFVDWLNSLRDRQQLRNDDVAVVRIDFEGR